MKAQPIIQPADISALGFKNEHIQEIYEALYECQNEGVFDDTITVAQRQELILIAAEEISRFKLKAALDTVGRNLFPNWDEIRAARETMNERHQTLREWRDPVTGLRAGQTVTQIVVATGPDSHGDHILPQAFDDMTIAPNEGKMVRFDHDPALKSVLDNLTI